MKLGFLLGYSGKQVQIPIDLIKQAESMGYDSVWTAEAYGNDAVTPLGLRSTSVRNMELIIILPGI